MKWLGTLTKNRAVAGAAGFAVGWKAMQGNLFAILIALGSWAEYQQQKREAAIEAARAAAVETAKEACGDNADCLKSPETIEAAKAAAVKAGKAALDGEPSSRLSIVAACILWAFIGVLIGAALMHGGGR